MTRTGIQLRKGYEDKAMVAGLNFDYTKLLKVVRPGGGFSGAVRRSVAGITALAIVSLGLTPSAQSQERAEYFKINCSSCHRIGGGRLIGPDLKGATFRKDRKWLVEFILDPMEKLNSGDPYAMKLQKEAKGAVMIPVPGMTRKLAEGMLDFIQAESELDSSQFAGAPVSNAPFTEVEISRGLMLFRGETPLANSGPPCISCHTVSTSGASLGGQLGPDLTGVFERLQGRAAFTAWLGAPPTVTMQSLFKGHALEEKEVMNLVAFFESASNNTDYNMNVSIIWMSVVFFGLGGTAIGLTMFGGIWHRRFRAVRQPLIDSSTPRGVS